MLKTDSGDIIISASDLTALSNCEWSLVRKVDKLAGHDVEVLADEDEMLKRAAKLGDIHEKKYLAKLRAKGKDIVEFQQPDKKTLKAGSAEWVSEMQALTAQTLEAMRNKATVVFQGVFFDGTFQGFSDFLVLNEEGEYEVYDTKLARKAKITALLQLAAYAEQLQSNGIPTSSTVRLVLGNDGESVHKLADIMPVFKKRRDALRALIVEREHNFGAGGLEIQWGDPNFSICGSCANCKKEIEAHDDLLLVAGLTKNQRKQLLVAGILTLEALATTTYSGVSGIGAQTFQRLKAQAVAQLKTKNSPDPSVPCVVIRNSGALSALPPASPGDIFFDFEGDPLYEEDGSWNLDYLFGWVDRDLAFTPLWAHNLTDEGKAFEAFIEYLEERIKQFPEMHIYHYASYEKTHIVELSRRHSTGEELVSRLFDEHRLVDMYPIVKNAFILGGADYSLKTVEKIFRSEKRQGEVTNAVGSVIEYAKYCDFRDAEQHSQAAETLQLIADYNEDDCKSTFLLDQWLRHYANEENVIYVAPREPKNPREPWPDIYYELTAGLKKVPRDKRSDIDKIKALGAAATVFHRREKSVDGAEYYRRLIEPIDEWNDARDVFTIDTCEVISDWSATGPAGRRTLRVTGSWAPGSKGAGDSVNLFYGLGQPVGSGVELGGEGYSSSAKVLSETDDYIELEETLMSKPKAGAVVNDVLPHAGVPIALVPQMFISVSPIEKAIRSWAESNLLGTEPASIKDPALDILRKQGLRLEFKPEVIDHNFDVAIVDVLNQVENSYLAVQGPPGAGKSHNGAAAIVHFVKNRNWKVGVVGQSHATVENLFGALAKAGLSSDRMGKRPPHKSDANQERDRVDLSWTPFEKDSEIKEFISSDQGQVFGGTTWDFVNTNRVDRQQLDLLVIDEAGQFSLANTIAASVSAKRLLLLGDPQQLPQVTQASHEDPIDTSALGWLSEGHDVLPSEFGYFLDQSWRMHESLCTVVADLSYEGKLTAKGSPRHLVGHDPGFFPVPIHHTDNSTESTEEADAVVDKVRELVSLQWIEEGNNGALGDVEKNIIVVAPYNAQVQLIEAKLKAAGFEDIPVGTVDKFQGKEAAIAIVSMTASSATDVPRGIEFLLMQNRINVAISRAKWAAFMFYSPELTQFLPTNVEQLKLLSRFIALTDHGIEGS